MIDGEEVGVTPITALPVEAGDHQLALAADRYLPLAQALSVTGRQVLDELRVDPDLGLIPIVVLSTSTDDADVVDAYRLGTNSYVVKPVDLNEFFRVIEAVQGYWFDFCALPVSQN